MIGQAVRAGPAPLQRSSSIALPLLRALFERLGTAPCVLHPPSGARWQMRSYSTKARTPGFAGA